VTERILPDWVRPGAKAAFINEPIHNDSTVKMVTIARITPSGQVVLDGAPERFRPADFGGDVGRRSLSSGRWYYGSIELVPLDHPKVGKIQQSMALRKAHLAAHHKAEAWYLRPTVDGATEAITALERWKRVVAAEEPVGFES
jgi:hypothetical protein